jgi:hypothetical protein
MCQELFVCQVIEGLEKDNGGRGVSGHSSDLGALSDLRLRSSGRGTENRPLSAVRIFSIPALSEEFL